MSPMLMLLLALPSATAVLRAPLIGHGARHLPPRSRTLPTTRRAPTARATASGAPRSTAAPTAAPAAEPADAPSSDPSSVASTATAPKSSGSLNALSVGELKRLLVSRDVDFRDCLEKVRVRVRVRVRVEKVSLSLSHAGASLLHTRGCCISPV